MESNTDVRIPGCTFGLTYQTSRHRGMLINNFRQDIVYLIDRYSLVQLLATATSEVVKVAEVVEVAFACSSNTRSAWHDYIMPRKAGEETTRLSLSWPLHT